MALDNTDKAWKQFGESDPYFGVLSLPQYRQSELTSAGLREFFATGDDYAKDLAAQLVSELNLSLPLDSILDYGCGVGRLTVPLARYAREITGVDVSPAMLAEARSNCDRFRINNATFIDAGEWLSHSGRKYSLVHSFIVLQHIPTTRGMRIISALLDAVEDGGAAVLHLTYGKRQLSQRVLGWVRKRVPLANACINAARGRSLSAPAMQMNSYDLNSVFKSIQSRGATNLLAGFTDHGGHLGVTMTFRCNETTLPQSQAA